MNEDGIEKIKLLAKYNQPLEINKQRARNSKKRYREDV